MVKVLVKSLFAVKLKYPYPDHILLPLINEPIPNLPLSEYPALKLTVYSVLGSTMISFHTPRLESVFEVSFNTFIKLLALDTIIEPSLAYVFSSLEFGMKFLPPTCMLLTALLTLVSTFSLVS